MIAKPEGSWKGPAAIRKASSSGGHGPWPDRTAEFTSVACPYKRGSTDPVGRRGNLVPPGQKDSSTAKGRTLVEELTVLKLLLHLRAVELATLKVLLHLEDSKLRRRGKRR